MKKGLVLDKVFPLRMDAELYQALEVLGKKSERTKAQYVRFLIRKDAKEKGLYERQVEDER